MLFDEYELKKTTLANRFVRSATCEGMADEHGKISDRHIELFKRLSQGGIGLIVTGHMYVRRDGYASPGMAAVDRDECIPGLRKIADAVHSNGPSKIAVQINHGGRAASMCRGKSEILAPSAVPANDKAPVPRALQTDEIEELAICYADAAARVKEAGFDAVQIHGAHGYLVSQFLSPLANQREDTFGGSLENRARFLQMIVKNVRKRVTDDYLVMIKLASFDRDENGMTLEESVQVGKWLEKWGIDAVEVSGGINADSTVKGVKAGENEAFFCKQAAAFKKGLSIPVISVGGYRSIEVMENVLQNGDADLIAMSRPFIREPALVDTLRSGEQTQAACISCNRCFIFMHKGNLRCRFNK